MSQPSGTGDIPTTVFGEDGIRVSLIAQGGARMDLHPDLRTAAEHVRGVCELGITYFDCARSCGQGQSEESYGIGLKGVRKNVFLTTRSEKLTAKEATWNRETSLRSLKTNYVDLWRIHVVGSQEDMDRLPGPNGNLEAVEAAKKAGKCRWIGFKGHYDPAAHVALLQAYGQWDAVMMSEQELAEVRNRAVNGTGVYSGFALAYGKRKV